MSDPSVIRKELQLLYEDETGYRRGGVDDVTHLHEDVRCHIALHREVESSKVHLLWHEPEGEICIYINGKWSGYVSDYIKEVMDVG